MFKKITLNTERYLAFGLTVLAILSGMATYAALRAVPPLGKDSSTVIWLMSLDLFILFAFVLLISRRILALFKGRKEGVAGARLHVRLVYIFSVLAIAPAIIMTVFSAFFFHYGVQTWFSERVSTAVNKSQAVAQAYLEEHQQVIRADIMAMANDLDRQAPFLVDNQTAFDRLMHTQSVLRNLSEAIVFDSAGKVLARSGFTFSLELEEVPDYLLDTAQYGDAVVLNAAEDRVRALVKLNNFVDSYLFVGRMVDPIVLSYLHDTKQAVQDYEDLESRYVDLRTIVTMIFVVVGLLLLLAAIWFGFIFSRQLVTPIGALVSVSERVRSGDLSARVPEGESIEEFDYLARAFNRMTTQIQEQRNNLVKANRQLDQRRRFTETILAGVSAGIVGVNENGLITLANNSAGDLLQKKPAELAGKNIVDVVPGIKDALDQAHKKPDKIYQAELPYLFKEGDRRIFLIRVAIELINGVEKGGVITFDDITELQSAQRKAAWAGVARRIAHEIKNPLTPIQLSAERLKRRYQQQLPQEDQQVFAQCTDTIIRHVEDIGRMVSEFSSFARMPEPVMEYQNFMALVKESILLQQQAHSAITFKKIGFPEETDTVLAYCDSQQVRQAFTNILQNAIDSITGGNDKAPGHIQIHFFQRGDELVLAVCDTGKGFPKEENLSRLTEPYVTHREKGTGLGLAIVKKIMEDHNGRLLLGVPEWLRKEENWEDLGGACVVLALPVVEQLSRNTSIKEAS